MNSIARYLIVLGTGSISLLLGASAVHQYYKPNVEIPIHKYKTTLDDVVVDGKDDKKNDK